MQVLGATHVALEATVREKVPKPVAVPIRNVLILAAEPTPVVQGFDLVEASEDEGQEEYHGHPRGLRAGQACTGGARERGRAPCLLVPCPDWGPGDHRPWRALGASTRPRALAGVYGGLMSKSP